MTEGAGDVLYRLAAGGLEVVFRDEPCWTPGSADNLRRFDREIVLDEDSCRRAVGVTVEREGRVLASAVLRVGAWSPGAQEGSVVVRRDAIYFSAGPQVVALELPSLEPRWMVKVDDACVFGLHEIEEDALLVHGELDVTLLGMDGEIRWQHGGWDIFTGGCHIDGGQVVAVDWNGAVYRWRLSDGEVLQDPPRPVFTPDPHPRCGTE